MRKDAAAVSLGARGGQARTRSSRRSSCGTSAEREDSLECADARKQMAAEVKRLVPACSITCTPSTSCN
jgi:hypothetical protein